MRKHKQVLYLKSLRRCIRNEEKMMAKLVEFYIQHKRLFCAQKHQNTSKTEKFKNTVLIKFLSYCESQNIFHTSIIRKKQAIDFFNSNEMLSKSYETRRKYFLTIREFYKRFLKITLEKEKKEVLK